jgi:hypothetical protein
VPSAAVDTVLQLPAQAQQLGHPVRLDRRIELGQRGGAVRDADGGPPGREGRRGSLLQHGRAAGADQFGHIGDLRPPRQDQFEQVQLLVVGVLPGRHLCGAPRGGDGAAGLPGGQPVFGQGDTVR